MAALSRRRLPALLLTLTGVALVLLGGGLVWDASGPASPPTVHVEAGGTCDSVGLGDTETVVSRSGLSEPGQRAFDRARTAASNETWVAAERLPLAALDQYTGVYVLVGGELYAFEPTGETAPNGSRRVAVARVRGVPESVRTVDGFHDLDDLTDRERRVVRRALAEGETTTRGRLPTLDAAADYTGLGSGLHCVHDDGVFYEVAVSDRSSRALPPWLGLLLRSSVLLAGVATVVVGGWGYRAGARRGPMALLAGYAVLLVPVVPSVLGPFPSPFSLGAGPVVLWLLSVPAAVFLVYAAPDPRGRPGRGRR